MTAKTLADLTAVANVQAGDLLATWRSAGPLKSATAAQFGAYLITDTSMTGAFVQRANNLSDLASAATARTNLGLGSAAVLAAGVAANNAVQLNGSAQLPAVDGSLLTGLSGGIPDVIVQNQQANGVASATHTGQITAFDWVLNTIVRNVGSVASLAANAVTLPAGTYYVRARGAVGVNSNSINNPIIRPRLWNSTDSVSLGQGESIQPLYDVSDSMSSASSFQVSAVFTLAGSKAIKLQVYLGGPSINSALTEGPTVTSGAVEVYTTLEIWKVH